MTAKKKKTQSEHELYDHRRDPGEWSDQPVDVTVSKSSGSMTDVVTFRIPSDELDALEDAARKCGESISEFIRKAIGIRLHGEPIGPLIQVSPPGAPHALFVQSHIVSSAHQRNSDFFPDEAPETQHVVTR